MSENLPMDIQTQAERERQRAEAQAQLREVLQARFAGEAALRQALEVEDSLGRAKGWGVFDLLGGGFLSAMAKHSRLDDAQTEAQELQTLLTRFRSELADVHIDPSLGAMNVEGFWRFADYIFDGVIADFAVLSHIDDAQEKIGQVKTQINYALAQLAAIEDALNRRVADLS